VVVPVDLAGRPSFATLVRRVTRSLADAVAHRALPFDQLVRALDVDRDPRRIPLCDIMFAPPGGDVRLSLPRVSVTRRPPERTSVAADLTLTIERGCPVAGSLAYRTCLFDRMSVARLLGQLRTLLDAALANPDLSIDLLPLDDRYRLRTIVHDGDRIAAALQDARPAHELCRARALRWPDAPAVAWQGRIVTYAELAANAAAVNALLPAAAGTPVAVRMATGPSQVAAVLGVLQSGAHVVCLHRGDTGERGRALLRSLRPGHVLVDQPVGTDPLALWYADELGGRVIDVSGVGTSDTRIAPTDMTGRAYVTYTSGSTGTPKVIPQSHATLAQFATWFARQFHIGPGVRVAQWTAPGYDASLCEMFAALVSGATLCPVPDRMRASPGLIVDWLAEHRVTIFQTVPSFARQLLAMLRRRGGAHRLRSLTHLLLAGEELAGELANGLRATLPHAQLVNLYGPTESVLATWHEITGPVHGSVPIGRPIPGRQVLVLDEADLPCPTGVTGEIVLRGPYLTSGYLGAAGDTAAFASLPARPEFGIAAGPCYRTGDLARLRWDGTLEFRGRKDFQVKINGIRVELGDIEAALTAHASVAECTVVAIPRANGTATRLCAYVVPRRGPSGAALGGADEWRNALRSRFGRAMPPVLLRTVIGLPRGSSGKVDRHRLPSPWAARAALRMPVTSVTNDVTAIWTTVLGDTPSDDFFAAGGHSLLALELLAAVRDRFGVTVALPDFLADPTIAGIRSLVEMTAIAPSA
jgi:amino acid adenylation domain-containing protein